MAKNQQIGMLFIVFGLLVIAPVVFVALRDNTIDKNMFYFLGGLGGFISAIGYLMFSGQKLTELNFKGVGLKFSSIQLPEPPKRELEPQILLQRQQISSQFGGELPGQSAPEFHVLEEKLAFQVIPCSDPMTPMYMLDNNYRILDWNNAFSSCFDRTMEGRRGLNVLEWTYFLENYEEVLDHGIKTFSDPDNLPRIDIETIRYKSRTYGPIVGKKRAYQIPNDDNSCLGWLITIDPEFETPALAQQYQIDLFSRLRLGLMWSEYALSYDVVLNRSDIYPNLIKTVVGVEDGSGPMPLPNNSKVLDLGAGTGNITVQLSIPSANRLVVALDNNSMMLNVLRRKCKRYLRENAQGPGVIAIKQDITSLYGLKDKFFDAVVINNVLYSLENNSVEQCLKEVYRVLSPGGEVRISEPHKQANAAKVMDKIKQELQKKGCFEEVSAHYLKVKEINETFLSQMLNKWDIDDMEALLLNVGFAKITFKMVKTYAGQSFLICAKK
ncbi:MAG: class I SAM-dependent methyltransferase [Gammaproteobacteria bacterium]